MTVFQHVDGLACFTSRRHTIGEAGWGSTQLRTGFGRSREGRKSGSGEEASSGEHIAADYIAMMAQCVAC
jgi:hypothetical protein